MHAPAEAVARGGGKHLIFLRVVEILQIKPWLLLAKRRCRQRALAIGLEGAEVMFQPGHERDTLDRAGRRQCIKHIAYHGAIDLDVFCFGVLPQPRADENIGGAQALQGQAERVRIQQIAGHRTHTFNVGGRPSRQSVHLPSPFMQVPREVIADNTAGPDHKR
jgi:hypothetical protein